MNLHDLQRELHARHAALVAGLPVTQNELHRFEEQLDARFTPEELDRWFGELPRTMLVRVDEWLPGGAARGLILSSVPLYRVMDEREVALLAAGGPRTRIGGGLFSIPIEREGGAQFGTDRAQVEQFGRNWRGRRLEPGPLYVVEVSGKDQAFTHAALKPALLGHYTGTPGHYTVQRDAYSTGLGCSVLPWAKYGVTHAWRIPEGDGAAVPVEWSQVLAEYARDPERVALARREATQLMQWSELSNLVDLLDRERDWKAPGERRTLRDRYQWEARNAHRLAEAVERFDDLWPPPPGVARAQMALHENVQRSVERFRGMLEDDEDDW